MINEIPNLLIAEEFYFSALTFLENVDGDIRLLIKCLYHLGFTKKILTFIEQYPELLEIYEIKKIYLSVCKPSDLIFMQSRRTLPEFKERLAIESVEKYMIGKLYIGEERKRMFLEAFDTDERNFESLLSLHRESLLPENDIRQIFIKMKNKMLSSLYRCVLYENFDDFLDLSIDIPIKNNFSISRFLPKNYNSRFFVPEKTLNFFSPFFAEKLAIKLMKDRRKDDLFRLGVYMIENFDSEISYSTLGYYYLMTKNFKEAKKCFYISLKRNDKYSIAWLYLGISYSGLKECENAISSFKNAEKHMISSYKPSFYLAYEYHRMNNYEKAYIYYKKAMKIKNNPEIAYRYAIFLIYYEKYEAAYKIAYDLPYNEIRRLILGFIYYYTNKIDKAMNILDGNDWRTIAFKGFLFHLSGDFEKASEMYCNVLVKHDCTVIKDLLKLCKSQFISSLSEHIGDLFETMEIKNMTEMPL
ncbi:Cell division cycle protein 16 like protein [Dictyocoela muelleri]|nr:Cell division cycle protein 16 like protein [Dictyocoela muelleri]